MKSRLIKTTLFNAKIKTNQTYLGAEHLERWKAAINAGEKPVVIVHKGYILDGNHRAAAYMFLNSDTIPCVFLTNEDLRNYLFFPDNNGNLIKKHRAALA